MQTALGALILLTVLAGAAYNYVLQRRYAPAVMDELELPRAVVPVEAGPVVGAKADVVAVEGTLRAEVAALRGELERHDKMLRYIMERYVEKDAGSGDSHMQFLAHEAQEVNLSAQEFVSQSPGADLDALAGRPNDATRRKRRGEAGPIGAPELELPPVESEQPAVAEVGVPVAESPVDEEDLEQSGSGSLRKQSAAEDAAPESGESGMQLEDAAQDQTASVDQPPAPELSEVRAEASAILG